MTAQQIASIVNAFTFWYLFYSVELAINGGFFGCRFPLLEPFRSAWQDFLWAAPGGRRRRGNFIRKMVEPRNGYTPNGAMISESGGWDYEEIRAGDRYDEVGAAMLPGLPHFLIMHVVIPWSVFAVTRSICGWFG